MNAKVDTDPVDIRIHVREHYGEIASSSGPKEQLSCCDPAESTSGCCAPDAAIPIDQIAMLYEAPDAADLPDEVKDLSLGCGDPVTLASLKTGQVVLDLGSGGGIDCFLAAKRVGETGRVIGVDMTPAMIEKARANKKKVGAENVEFRLGEIENLPAADESVDVIISNCVINLSPDKGQVFREAYRVLKPGGRIAVSDIVTDGPLPEPVKESLAAWAGCVAGALDVREYLAGLEEAGFTEIEIRPVYFERSTIEEAAGQLELTDLVAADDELAKSVFSAKIQARKPI